MNKRILIFSAVALAVLCACHPSKVRITGRFVGNDAQSVYLEQVTTLSQSVIDSTVLSSNGSYRFDVKEVAQTPSLYNLIYNGERIPLLIAAGDRVTVSVAGSVIRNYTVQGSEESDLLRSFYQPYVESARYMDRLVATLGALAPESEERQALVKQYTEEYYKIRRAQLRFIIENKAHLAAVYALYQRLPGDTNLFNSSSDVIYYRTVAEALEQSYPLSPYLAALNAEIARMDAQNNLSSRITEAGYPDLEISDMYGKKMRFSSLKGKVVLLDFWSAALGTSNQLNAELKEIYKKYSNAGFEVYQVAIDTSKPIWVGAVQDQQLPWISVCDLKGDASPAIGLYNIRTLPANYLINKEGTIVARDLYGQNLEQKIAELIQ